MHWYSITTNTHSKLRLGSQQQWMLGDTAESPLVAKCSAYILSLAMLYNLLLINLLDLLTPYLANVLLIPTS